jgi:glutamate/tyrosine decarboxylase-like PLP-dependent enzyme
MFEVEAFFKSYVDDVKHGPVAPRIGFGDTLRYLGEHYTFDTPLPLDHVVDDVRRMLLHGDLHNSHPRYFGLFNPHITLASVVADAMVAATNPQVGGWFHSPAAVEIEQHVLRFFARRFGLADDSMAHFTSGGSEANATAVMCALAWKFPEWRRGGARALAKQPALFVSVEAHHSFEKIAQQTGLGRDAVRLIEVDERDRMQAAALERAIEVSRANGEEPFFVVATVGTTGTGAIDPLPDIADICAREQLWMHADAAWGGAAAVSDRLRPHLAGIERADSITCDAHKWISVAMGAGMFFTSHRDVLREAFSVDAPYVPKEEAGPDFYALSLQWSRRFIGLKVFLTVAELGAEGLARQVEHHVEIADILRARLIAAGWSVISDSPLAVVCFTRENSDIPAIATAVVRDGRAWISPLVREGRHPVLRACVTNYETSERDVEILIESLDAAHVQSRQPQ